MDNIFRNFDLNKIKKLRIYKSMNLFNIPLVDHAEKFTSLESLNVNLDETVFVSIVRTLRQNSFKRNWCTRVIKFI